MDDNVIKINNNKASTLFTRVQNVARPCESKGHDKKLIRSAACHTCHLCLICFNCVKLIVPISQVKLVEIPWITELAKEIINARNEKLAFYDNLVKRPVVDA